MEVNVLPKEYLLHVLDAEGLQKEDWSSRLVRLPIAELGYSPLRPERGFDDGQRAVAERESTGRPREEG